MPRSRSSRLRFSVACFGEVLWDILPRGIFLGGAPLNVGYHLSRLGAQAWPVSAVGRDFLGDEALRRIGGWNVSVDFVTRGSTPTGTVRATLDARGVARYRIMERVAWDRIDATRAERSRRAPDALVFGSLALRSAANRRALADLVAAWPTTLRVLDLNLRAPFDRGRGVMEALRHAQFVKLNDEELARMTGKPARSERQLEAAARGFAAAQRVTRLCVTGGARGAGLLWEGDWLWEAARPVAVRDTIGAGDAFLAAFLAAHFGRGATPREALRQACRLGEFIATRDGATPPYIVDRNGRPQDGADST